MNNKEVIQKLKDYFLTQSPETVAYACASLLVDMNRIDAVDSLPKEEVKCLLERIKLNAQELRRFVKEGPTKDLSVVRMNSNENI